MVAWRYRSVNLGEGVYERVVEYEFDSGYSAEMRALEEQAAIECGQFKPKHQVELSGRDGGPIRVQNLSALSDDELAAFIAIARKLESAGVAPGAEGPESQPDGETVSDDGAPAPGSLPEAS
jgi:hypothetical protein